MEVRDLVGIPYRMHGRGRDGMDCYGLVIEVERRAGKSVPDAFYDVHSTRDNEDAARKIDALMGGITARPLPAPKPYCIVGIAMHGRDISHVGVYLGDGMFIHCTEVAGVCVQPVARYSHLIKGYFEV